MITVPPQIPIFKPCKLAFVGEAPGVYEMAGHPRTKVRRPLIGPSGKIHDEILKAAGIDRTECLTTNVFNTQLPDNEVKNWCASTVEAKTWKNYDYPPIVGTGTTKYYLRPEYLNNLERLEAELQEFSPNVIVALGGTALWALTGYSNIVSRRGAIHEASMMVHGTKVLPAFHPAYIMQYAYKMKPLSVMDYIKAAHESNTKEIKTTPREIWIAPTISDLYEFRDKYLNDAPYISLDIETPFLKAGIPKAFRQIKEIGFADGPHHAIVVPFVDERKLNKSYWSTKEEEFLAKKFVKEICENDKPKLLQNGAAFDLYWLWDRYRICVLNHIFDTRLEHHVIWPELPKSLQVMGSLHSNERAWKTLSKHVLKRDN